MTYIHVQSQLFSSTNAMPVLIHAIAVIVTCSVLESELCVTLAVETVEAGEVVIGDADVDVSLPLRDVDVEPAVVDDAVVVVVVLGCT